MGIYGPFGGSFDWGPDLGPDVGEDSKPEKCPACIAEIDSPFAFHDGEYGKHRGHPGTPDASPQEKP